MITVSGNTFNHRDLLKGWRGRWNPSLSVWEFNSLTTTQVAELRKIVGVSVSEKPDDKPERLNVLIEELTRKREPIDIDGFFERLFDDETKPLTRTGRTAFYGDDPRYLNYFRDQNPTAFFGFSSLTAFADYVAGLDRPRSGRDAGWEGREHWAGTATMSDALDLARKGWDDGVSLADGLEIPHAVNRKRIHGVAGGSVNVGRMLAGNPAHMRRRPKQDGKRITTLFVETFMSAGIDPDNAIRRAVLISRIADVMEREGYSCEIVAVCTTSAGRNTGHQAAITLKQAGERLNLLDVVFALGHPSFFRRMIFGAVGAADECGSTWSTQGMPSAAFDVEYPCKRNEFYIKQLSIGQQRRIDETDPLSMLPFIEPDGLPITLRKE